MFALEGVDSVCLCSPPLVRLIHTEPLSCFPITSISAALDGVAFPHQVLQEYGAEETETGNPLPSYFISSIFTFTVTQIPQHGSRKTSLLIQGNVQCRPRLVGIILELLSRVVNRGSASWKSQRSAPARIFLH